MGIKMPAAHSYDLRIRAMAHYERHGSATLTSETFKISRSIIYDWKKRKSLTGDIRAKGGYQKGYGHKISNLDDLKQVVEQAPGLTLKKIIQKSGIQMSVMTCCRALKRLNFTRKKRPTIIRSKMTAKGKHF
jgi:transposase